MFSRPSLFVPLAMLCTVASLQAASPMDIGSCTIYVNGREAFIGIMGSNASPHDALRAIGSMDIRPSPNSRYMLNGDQGVDLVGDIELAVSGQPSMRMQSLRIVYAPFQIDSLGNQGTSRWRIHRDDAAKIKAYYKPTAERMRNQQIGITFRQWNVAFVIGGATALLLTVTFFLFYILFQGPRIIAATSSAPAPSARGASEL